MPSMEIINDEATLKRVYYYPEQGKIMLIPENAKYEPFMFVGDELFHFKTIKRSYNNEN